MARPIKRSGRRRLPRVLIFWALAPLALISSCEPSDVASPQREVARPRVIERVPVASSNLQCVGYDETTRTLTIEFRNGSVYEYADVPPEVHDELMHAESHGKYFHRQIRNAGYKTRRVQ